MPIRVTDIDWRPSADLQSLQHRATLLQVTRRFFADREVLEVETPILSQSGSTEVHLEHFVASPAGHHLDLSDVPDKPAAHYFLNTSAELAMKRLLAAGTGDIYQISKVFRANEQGARHQPEFTMLEWYRVGFDLNALMNEVALLLTELVGAQLSLPHVTYGYSEVFYNIVQLDPLQAPIEQLRHCFKHHSGYDAPDLDDRQAYLDLIMSYIIEPRFNPAQLTFVTHYPAEQASLARLNANNPDIAERFEAFAGGLELANGYHELSDVNEQRQRMLKEKRIREQRKKPALEMDHRFLAALDHGLPDCSGVAVGFDRVCMLSLGRQRIDEVISFSIENA